MKLTRARALSLLVLLLVGVAWLVMLPRLKLTTEIAHFLPDFADKQAATLTRSIAEGDIARTLVLDVSGDTPEKLAETALAIATDLKADPATDRVRSGLDESSQAKVLELFTGKSPTAMLEPSDYEDAAILARLDLLRSRLGSPMGPLIRDLSRRDPLGGALGTLDRLTELDGSQLTSDRGVLFTADQKHAFVIAVTKGGALDAPAQRAYLEHVDQAFKKVAPAGQKLEISGVARMTVTAEAQIRGDIERIGTISTVGILLLFAVLFRSPRMLGLGMIPLLFGAGAAIVATQLVYGYIHGLTLAFGTSLLGVGIDYAEHYFSHYALAPERGAPKVMSDVWPGLWMGAITTIVGFSGLALTGFPGVRQIAFFSTVAIAFSLFGTKWLVPPWMPEPYKPPAFMSRLAGWTSLAIAVVGKRRWILLAPAIVGFMLLPGLLRTKFVDDVSVLLSLDPQVVAEDVSVRDRLSPMDPGRFVIVVQPDEEQAILALEKTTHALEKARQEHLIDGYTPIGALLRSQQTQRASFAAAKAARGRIEEHMKAKGMVTEAFAPFFEELDKPEAAVLTLDDLKKSPLGDLVGAVSPRLPEGQAFMMPLRGVKDLEALRARLPDAILIDEPLLLETTYRGVRRKTSIMLFVGLGLVGLTLMARYRSLRLSFAALLPGMLGAAGAIGLFGALGKPLNLMHLVGILLVLSMGTDYGIFVVEGRDNADDASYSLVSIVTATSTTLLSFGLLALSPSPAMRALGTTITVGLMLAAAFCPVVSVFLAKKKTS